ncbi:MAG: hypothetical protein IJI71_03095 [Clostridia bacterium]|nr:hypothetical protein [Clostridia bacterium]
MYKFVKDKPIYFGAYVEFDHEPTREEVVEKLTAQVQGLLPVLVPDSYDEGRLIMKPASDDRGWTAAIKLQV